MAGSTGRTRRGDDGERRPQSRRYLAGVGGFPVGFGSAYASPSQGDGRLGAQKPQGLSGAGKKHSQKHGGGGFGDGSLPPRSKKEQDLAKDECLDPLDTLDCGSQPLSTPLSQDERKICELMADVLCSRNNLDRRKLFAALANKVEAQRLLQFYGGTGCGSSSSCGCSKAGGRDPRSSSPSSEPDEDGSRRSQDNFLAELRERMKAHQQKCQKEREAQRQERVKSAGGKSKRQANSHSSNGSSPNMNSPLKKEKKGKGTKVKTREEEKQSCLASTADPKGKNPQTSGTDLLSATADEVSSSELPSSGVEKGSSFDHNNHLLHKRDVPSSFPTNASTQMSSGRNAADSSVSGKDYSDDAARAFPPSFPRKLSTNSKEKNHDSEFVNSTDPLPPKAESSMLWDDHTAPKALATASENQREIEGEKKKKSVSSSSASSTPKEQHHSDYDDDSFSGNEAFGAKEAARKPSSSSFASSAHSEKKESADEEKYLTNDAFDDDDNSKKGSDRSDHDNSSDAGDRSKSSHSDEKAAEEDNNDLYDVGEFVDDDDGAAAHGTEEDSKEQGEEHSKVMEDNAEGEGGKLPWD